MNATLERRFRVYAEAQWKRVLTQMDRDPDSPTFGCFDRNYWHYKIRDFPSALLQQGVFTLEAIRRGQLGCAPSSPPVVEEWCAAAINALERQTNAAGAVDEYYPNEHSYPSAAFGLHAAARCLGEWRKSAPRIAAKVRTGGLRRLAAHLSRRLERQASNQQAAGLAALAHASAIPELDISVSAVERHAARFFSTQHAEGWFDEYGGPDFGYLTVTLDALVDYHDATGDRRALQACDRAIDFLAGLVGSDGDLPWTLNSRNTDYVVPYGLVRRAEENGRAAWLIETLFGAIDDPRRHFLWATDDRYHCHYIFASVVRCLPHLGAMRLPEPAPLVRERWLPGCGFWIRRGDGWTLYVAAKKGGVTRLHSAPGPARVDHGWRIAARDGRRWTTNWWTDAHTIRPGAEALGIEGTATRVTYHVPSPLLHIGLRVLAWLLRERLIPLLKRAMIFRPGAPSGPRFVRTIEITGAGIRIRDEFPGLAPGYSVARSPRRNLRHVASADSFSAEEWTALVADGALSLEWSL